MPPPAPPANPPPAPPPRPAAPPEPAAPPPAPELVELDRQRESLSQFDYERRRADIVRQLERADEASPDA